MVKIPVDECPAGPAMDAAVAKALGLEIFPHSGLWDGSFAGGGWCPVCRRSFRSDVKAAEISCSEPPPYSTDLIEAWPLLFKMQSAYGILLAIFRDLIECKIMKDDRPIVGRAQNRDVTLAISRTFLKANGVEYIEVPWKGAWYAAGEGVLIDRD
jgi:hypothetical protein